jgi:hypothetical protein
MQNPLFNAKAPTLNVRQDGNPVCTKCEQPIGEGQMRSWNGGSEAHLTCPPPHEQDQEWQSPILKPKLPVQRQPDIQQSARQSSRESAVASISSDGRRWEKVGSRKEFRGILPNHNHAFAVSSDSANLVVMALAEAGVRNFEVATDYDINASYFSFPTPADKEMASDLLSKKLAPQIVLW